MGSFPFAKFNLYPNLLIILFTIVNLTLTSTSKSSSPDYTTLVYKGCAKQLLSDPTGLYSQSLSSLFTSLIQQSSRSQFFKTTSGGPQGTIIGLFQCRGDLSTSDCSNCVSKIPQLSDQLCGKVVAARVQLLGCYMLYQVSGYTQISGMQLLYRLCSRTNVAGAGFEMRRDTALTVMQNGLVSSGNRMFFATNYESVAVLGQCEGDLSTADCGLCIKTAVQRAQVECGSALASQVYLHKCFISYSYYPNGVPKSSGDGFSPSGYPSHGSRQNTGKTVAIIVGGTACVGFLIICVLFVRGLHKKDDGMYQTSFNIIMTILPSKKRFNIVTLLSYHGSQLARKSPKVAMDRALPIYPFLCFFIVLFRIDRVFFVCHRAFFENGAIAYLGHVGPYPCFCHINMDCAVSLTVSFLYCMCASVSCNHMFMLNTFNL